MANGTKGRFPNLLQAISKMQITFKDKVRADEKRSTIQNHSRQGRGLWFGNKIKWSGQTITQGFNANSLKEHLDMIDEGGQVCQKPV